MDQRTTVSVLVIVAAIIGIGILSPPLHAPGAGSEVVQRGQAAGVSSPLQAGSTSTGTDAGTGQKTQAAAVGSPQQSGSTNTGTGAGSGIVQKAPAADVSSPQPAGSTNTGADAGTGQKAQAAAVGSPLPAGSTNAGAGAGNNDFQTFNLGYKNGRYDPPEIRVKQGTKVRIIGDPTTLRGCMLVVNIEGYGISKPIRAGDNVIEFTADKAGTFPIYCNMGIGNGKLVVDAG